MPTNKNKYVGDVNSITYRSRWELDVCKWLDTNINVEKWSSEETIVPYFSQVDNKARRYFVDFTILFSDGTKLLVEVKPAHQTKPPKKSSKRALQEAVTYQRNEDKWVAASAFAKKNGLKFVVWTEHELAKLGILHSVAQKTPGKLKPLKRPKPFRKRKTRKK